MADPREAAYKDAIADGIRKLFPDIDPLPRKTEIELTIYLGRKLEGRVREADNTNMQKLAEDALHGILYHDDKWTRRISTESFQSRSIEDAWVGFHATEHHQDLLYLPPWLEGHDAQGVENIWDQEGPKQHDDWEAPEIDEFFT